ncbi:MmcQ/YjbR family DNA-binding protein [Sporomusa termitida]|uniref:YjbR n=1 Tax=Sporomusa termitida TaxID=2377 RepID=A0A517DYK5_9FIRM|nr:MmcQ/YjbR family DNA-binding protein [Sporomusa termitida]QDR82413.1 YjbR [Sporomusa termitida]
MNSKECYCYCLTKLGAIEDYPFGPGIIVIRVAGKIFALLSRWQGQDILSLKCEPNYSELLRQQYPAVIPGYHLNKRHWNTLLLNGTIPAAETKGLIDHSYELVFSSRGRSKRTGK